MREIFKRNNLIALLITISFHVLLVLVSIYTAIWSAPPKLPYGIEINFSSEKSVSSEVRYAVQSSKPTSQPKPAVEKVEAVKTDTEIPDEASDVKAVEEKVEDFEQVTPEAESQKLPIPPELESSTNAKTKLSNRTSKLNTDALLTKFDEAPSGAQLDMPGWGWEEPPKKVDQSEEQGKIIFEITIDENGEIIAVKTKFRSVSKLVANFYQAEVNKLIFLPNNLEITYDGITKGYITFILKAK